MARRIGLRPPQPNGVAVGRVPMPGRMPVAIRRLGARVHGEVEEVAVAGIRVAWVVSAVARVAAALTAARKPRRVGADVVYRSVEQDLDAAGMHRGHKA